MVYRTEIMDGSRAISQIRDNSFQINEIEKISLEAINCAVPQNPTLGPLLFLLYVNDLIPNNVFR